MSVPSLSLPKQLTPWIKLNPGLLVYEEVDKYLQFQRPFDVNYNIKSKWLLSLSIYFVSSQNR